MIGKASKTLLVTPEEQRRSSAHREWIRGGESIHKININPQMLFFFIGSVTRRKPVLEQNQKKPCLQFALAHEGWRDCSGQHWERVAENYRCTSCYTRYVLVETLWAASKLRRCFPSANAGKNVQSSWEDGGSLIQSNNGKPSEAEKRLRLR